jgi:CHAT domain-containing protein
MLDYAISSYVPTITGLILGRERRTSKDRSVDRGLLAVAMGSTPGHVDLPAAEEEVSRVTSMWPGRSTVLINDAATSARVADALRTHEVAHFACHADFDTEDASSGHLALADDGMSPLSVWRVVDSEPSGHAELVYLSACSTSRPNIALPAEGLHVASAFYAAGFAQAIGNLWRIDDDVALGACVAIYASMLDPNATGSLNGGKAVNAWERAERLRNRNAPTTWANLVHTGL